MRFWWVLLACGCTFHVDPPDVHVEKVELTACFAIDQTGRVQYVECPDASVD